MQQGIVNGKPHNWKRKGVFREGGEGDEESGRHYA